MGFSINVPKLKYLNGISNLDMSQNTVMLKIREQLKERLEKKKYENIEKQEKLKNQLKQSLYLSSIAESNPIVIKLVEFGYNIIYSRRVFYYW